MASPGILASLPILGGVIVSSGSSSANYIPILNSEGQLDLSTIPSIVGAGTVTNFSSGILSPLFSTSVADSTTTPTLTFTLSTASQNAVLAGPASGGTGAPSYRYLVAEDLPGITYSSLIGLPTLGSLSSITPTGIPNSNTYLKYDGTTYSWTNPPGSGTVTNVVDSTGLFTISTSTTTPTFTLIHSLNNASGLVQLTNTNKYPALDGSLIENVQGSLTLTTTGSGAATLVGNTLNIPTPASGVTTFNTRSGAVTLQASDLAISGASLTAVPSNPSLYPTLNQNTTGSAGSVALTNITGAGTGVLTAAANTVNASGGLLTYGVSSATLQTLIGSNIYDSYGAATGLLSSANTWNNTNTFTGDVVLPNTTTLSLGSGGLIYTNGSTGDLTAYPALTPNLNSLNAAVNSVGGFLSYSISSSTLQTLIGSGVYQPPITLTTTGTSGAATFTSNTLNIPQYSGTTYTAGTGLTLTSTSFSVNTSQNINTLSNLTTNGFVKTTGGTGALSIDTNTYLTANQTITLTGDTTGSGSTSISTTTSRINGTSLAGLSSGLLYNTTATGVPSIATSGQIQTAIGSNVYNAYNANTTTLGNTTTGSGSIVLATSPSFTTPSLGAATATSLNGLTISTSTGTLTIANAKTFTANNTLTLSGTDGSTLNVGAGGTLGSNAYTSTAYVPQTTTVNGHALSSNVIVSASDITTGTLPHGQLPTLVSGDIPNNAANTSGSAGSLLNGPTFTTSSGTFTLANSKTLTVNNTLTLSGPDGSTLNIGSGGTLGSNAYTSTAYVPQSTTVNGHALSGNIVVSASDLTTGTLPHAQLPTLLSTDIPNNTANTTGSAGSFTGNLLGDVTGTQSATVVGKINGTSLAGLSTGLLKNTTSTGVPSIGVAGTDYAGISSANTFSNLQTVAGGLQAATGPNSYIMVMVGDSRFVAGWFDAPAWGGEIDTVYFNESPVVNKLAGNSYCWTLAGGSLGSAIQTSGFGYNSLCVNYGISGGGIQNAIYSYALGCVSITGCSLTSGSTSVTLGSTTGLSGSNMLVNGPGVYPLGLQCSTSSTSATLADQLPGSRKASATLTNQTLVFCPPGQAIGFATGSYLSAYAQNLPHMLSPAVTGNNGILFVNSGINDIFSWSTSCSGNSSSATLTGVSLPTINPYGGYLKIPVGYTVTGTNIPANTTVASNTNNTIVLNQNPTGSVSSVTITPVTAVWETQFSSYITTAQADNWNQIVIMCPWPAYTTPWSNGESFRQTIVSWIKSTYGSTSGITVLATDALPIFSTTYNSNGNWDRTIYQEGVHLTPRANAIVAQYIQQQLGSSFTNGQPLTIMGPASINPSQFGPTATPLFLNPRPDGKNTVLILPSGGNIGWGNQAATDNPTFKYDGSNTFTFGNPGSGSYINLGIQQNGANPSGVGQIPVIPHSQTTVVNGSTSGTATFTQPFYQDGFKVIVVQCNALLGTASYTFLTPFSFAPVELDTLGLATTISNTAVTITGTTTTKTVILGGY